MFKYLLAFVFLILAALAILGYVRYFSPATGFSGKAKIIYLPSNDTRGEKVVEVLKADSIIKNANHFEWVAKQMKYWDHAKPGRYRISSGMSIFNITRLLRNGKQEPSRLVINHLRLPEDLAKLMAKNIEADSATIMKILAEPDSSGTIHLNKQNWSAYIIPNTYELFWTWPPEKALRKLIDEHEKWWGRDKRKEKAAAMGLTPEKVHIIASIVEEETNKKAERPLVASVYLNRLKRGMPLQADPTIRFALKDFKSNRIYYNNLRTPSAYNTYLNAGLPPGPICTASPSSLEAVLNAPETDYIFFVANADLGGGHTFTTNLTDHSKAAKLYQQALTEWQKRKAARENTKKDSLNKPGQTGKP